MNKKQAVPDKSPLGSGGKIELKKNNKDQKSIEKEKQAPLAEEKNEKDKNKKDAKAKDQKKEQKDKKDKKEKGKDAKDKGKDQAAEEVDDKKSKKKKQKDSKKDKKDKQKELKKDKSDKKLNKSHSKQKLDKQAETIKSIRNSQNRAKMTIQQLIQQYKGEAEKILFHNKGHDSQKEKQIEKQLSKLQQQKQKRHKKLEELEKHKEEIRQSRVKQKQIKQQLKRQRSKEKKMQSIKNKLQTIEQNAKERKEQHAKFIQYAKQRKQFVPRFKRYEKVFEQQKEAQREHIEETLQDIDKVYKPINLKQIQKFEQNYMAQKMESERYRVSKITLQSELINEQNKKLQEKLWRGRCHQVVKNQIEDSRVRKNADHQKQINRKEYGRLISQNISKEGGGQVEENKDKVAEQQSEAVGPLNLHVREKYIHGVNYGLVSEPKTIPMSLEQKAQLGKQYLSFVKQKNKHRKNKTIDNASLRKSKDSYAQEQARNKSKIYKIRRKSNPYYSSQQGRKSLDFKNYESIEYTLQKIKASQIQRELQDKILRHGEHPDILAIQEKKRKLGAIVVKEIHNKLQLLSKL